MTLENLILQIEALVFASEKAINNTELLGIMRELHPEADFTMEEIENSITAIKEKYDSEFHSFSLMEIGGGYQFLTKKQFHTTIAKLNGDKFLKRLSTAAIETLAIIAYKQPITKPDVEYIRGVNCDYSVQKLLEKELIVISGRNEEAVGKPLLYNTSKTFMDYLGLNSIDDLPRLTELFSQDIVLPTNAADAVPESNTVLVVGQDGEMKEVNVENESGTENENEGESENNLEEKPGEAKDAAEDGNLEN
jgi:segregation and condensation protein B